MTGSGRGACLVGLLLALLAGCADSGGRPVPITVLWDGDRCGLAVGATHVPDLRAADAQQRIVALVPERARPLHLTNGIDTPYRCIGSMIYTLQRLGYRRIGFISKPPPPTSAQ